MQSDDAKNIQVQSILEDDRICDTGSRAARHRHHTTRLHALLFILALLNNTPYVVIVCGAQDLAVEFNMANYVPSFLFSLNIFSLLVRILNSEWLLQYRHQVKVTWCAGIWTAGYILFYCAYYFKHSNSAAGFIVCLIATVLIGASTSVADCTIIGFMKAVPADLIGAWSSGTGMAGIFGAVMYLIIKSMQIEFRHVVLMLVPLAIAHCLIFKATLHYKAKLEVKAIHQSDIAAHTYPSSPIEGEVNKRQHDTELLEARQNEPLNWEGIKDSMKWTGVPMLNLCAVYFLEYSCTTSFADRAHIKAELHLRWIDRNAFVLLGLSYQLGVFISRSSLSIIKINKVWYLTYIQIINFAIFFTVAAYRWMSTPFQLALMLGVGLMGGASYVNCYYLILNDGNLAQSRKELATNVASFFNDLGVLGASIFALIVSNYIITV